MLKLIEITGGILLLVRRFVPLALVLLAPIIVQIFLFHAFLEPSGLVMGLILVALEAYLGFGLYRESFRTVLASKPAA